MPAKKKPKMTKAEHKAMRALKKKLAAKKAMEDEMIREHKMTITNLPKVINKHYPTMKEATLLKMKTDLKVMKQVSKRIFDLKSYTIESLQEDIEYVQETYMRQSRTHEDHLDHLIELMQARLTTLTEMYNAQRQCLLDKAKMVESRLTKGIEHDEELMKVALLIRTTQHNDQEAEAIAEYTLKFDELKEKLQINHDKMEGTCERLLKNMWISLQKFVLDYQRKTSERRHSYHILLKIDEENSNCIRGQSDWINSMTDQIRHLKDKLKKYEKKYKIEVDDLKAEREEYVSLYMHLRNRKGFDEASDQRKIQTLVSISNETEKQLKAVVWKAERILKLVQMCRALETLEEKIIHPKRAEITSEGINHQNSSQSSIVKVETTNNPTIKSKVSFLHESLISEMKNLEYFWERVAYANMQRGILVLKKEKLLKENLILKESLRVVMRAMGKKCPILEDLDTVKITCQLPIKIPIWQRLSSVKEGTMRYLNEVLLSAHIGYGFQEYSTLQYQSIGKGASK